ncbi:MAG: hypothetical protein LBU66_07160 [Treponema sp.]|jgi:hypothetical protein|nr:hypothetical protein [Treponema sp.]
MKRITVVLILISLWCFSLNAADFGIMLDQNADFSAHEADVENTRIDYSGVLIPRLTSLLGSYGELYISAGLNYNYSYNFNDDLNADEPEQAFFVPELLRTEAALRFNNSEVRFGRMFYREPLEFIASGLFDGAMYTHSTKGGNFSVGCWYTGLLYKNRTVIGMTGDERRTIDVELDYEDFAQTYFASRRLFSALGWEHPALAGLVDIKTTALFQFDLNETNLHSQYFIAKAAIPFSYFIFDLGGSIELIENEDDFNTAFAGEAGLSFLPPSSAAARLTLRGRFTSGVSEDGIVGAFLPLTTEPQGALLKTNISGLSVLSLDYLTRLHNNFSANINASYFIRSDLGTYKNYPVTGIESDGYFLGMEFYGRLFWNLSTGTRLNMGGGVFLPSFGDAVPDAEMLWRAELKLILSIL